MTQTHRPLQLREMRTNTMLDIGITPIYDYEEQYWILSLFSLFINLE